MYPPGGTFVDIGGDGDPDYISGSGLDGVMGFWENISSGPNDEPISCKSH